MMGWGENESSPTLTITYQILAPMNPQADPTNAQGELKILKDRLFELETSMVSTYQQQKDRNREMFLISKEIEQLENPVAYAENEIHWEGHEVRF